MKKFFLTLSSLLSVVFFVKSETYMEVKTADGNVVRFDVSNVDEVVFEEVPVLTVSGEIGLYSYVDLGLSSGLKWATYNVGAANPTDSGDYYAWGETQLKDNYYRWDTYKWCTANDDMLETITKYCTNDYYGSIDDKIKLEPEDDAANVNWGSGWRMPTKEEFDELLNGCKWKWERNFNNTGVSGMLGTSIYNNNTIFLPASGHYYDDGVYGSGTYGEYWLSSLSGDTSNYAYYISFRSSDIDRNIGDRYAAYPVRAVNAGTDY